MSILEHIKSEINKPRINKDEWNHYDYRLPESLAREGTTIQNYFSDYKFNKHITIHFNKADTFDPTNYEDVKKLNRKIFKSLRKYNPDNYYSLSIFELHSDLITFHSHTVNNIPPDIEDDEIKSQIKRIGKNKIKSISITTINDQKGLCYYLSKSFNIYIYIECKNKKHYKSTPPYSEYFKALPTNKRLHQTIGLKVKPSVDIIPQSESNVKH